MSKLVTAILAICVLVLLCFTLFTPAAHAGDRDVRHTIKNVSDIEVFIACDSAGQGTVQCTVDMADPTGKYSNPYEANGFILKGGGESCQFTTGALDRPTYRVWRLEKGAAVGKPIVIDSSHTATHVIILPEPKIIVGRTLEFDGKRLKNLD